MLINHIRIVHNTHKPFEYSILRVINSNYHWYLAVLLVIYELSSVLLKLAETDCFFSNWIDGKWTKMSIPAAVQCNFNREISYLDAFGGGMLLSMKIPLFFMEN